MHDGRPSIGSCWEAATASSSRARGVGSSSRPRSTSCARISRHDFQLFRLIDTEFAWEGLFASTPDTLPYIGPHRRYPHHWFALGYGGNGMTFGFLAARLLLERWQGECLSDHALFEFGRMRRR